MSTPNGAVEQLLVKIGADVIDLKKGIAEGTAATKQFKGSVQTVSQELKGFRTQAIGAINGVAGIENVFDALSGKSKLTAGSIAQLTQLLPLLSNPVGAVTVAVAALGTGVMKVVEAERKLKENRTAELLKEVKTQAEAAGKGWDAYFKALEDGLSKTSAKQVQSLATQSATIDQNRKRFEENTATLQANNVKLREQNKEIEANIKSYKDSGSTHGWFGHTLDQEEAKLAANNAQIKANEDTISKGYTPALNELAETKAKVTRATKDLTDAQEKEKKQAEEIEDRLNAWLELQDMQAEKDKEEMSNLEDKLNAWSELVQMELDAEHARDDADAAKRTRDEAAAYNEMANASGEAFANIITGAQRADEAMRQLVKEIAAAILKMLLLKAISAMGGPEAALLGPLAGGLVGVATGATSSGGGMSSTGSAATGGGAPLVQINESPFLPRSAAEMGILVRRHLRDAIEDSVASGDLRVTSARRRHS